MFSHIVSVIKIGRTETKESFFTRTNAPLVGTLILTGDVSVSMAIALFR